MYKDVSLFGKRYRLRRLALAMYYGACALYGLFIIAGLWCSGILMFVLLG